MGVAGLSTDFDAVVSYTRNGKDYSLSARDLLQNMTGIDLWMQGDIATEFLLHGEPETSGGEADTVIWVQFQVRFYSPDRAYVSVVMENCWAHHRKNVAYTGRSVKLGHTSQTTVLSVPSISHNHNSTDYPGHYYDARWHY